MCKTWWVHKNYTSIQHHLEWQGLQIWYMLNNYPVARPQKTLWYFLFFKNQVHRKLCWHFATSIWLKSWILDVKQVHFRERRKLEQASHLKSLSGKLDMGMMELNAVLWSSEATNIWGFFCYSLKWVSWFHLMLLCSSTTTPLGNHTASCYFPVGNGGGRVLSGCIGTNWELGRMLRSLTWSSRPMQ